MNISIKKKLNIIGIGSVSTLLILLMVEVLFAQILTDTILNSINDNLALLIIMSGMFLFTIIISVVVGYFLTEDINLKSVRNATILSVLCLLLFLFIVVNSSLYLNYPEVYSKIHGFQILGVFPQVLIKFSIYILGDVFALFILEIIVFYLFFIIFLEKLYQKKVEHRE